MSNSSSSNSLNNTGRAASAMSAAAANSAMSIIPRCAGLGSIFVYVKYSRHSVTGHSVTGNIQLPDFF